MIQHTSPLGRCGSFFRCAVPRGDIGQDAHYVMCACQFLWQNLVLARGLVWFPFRRLLWPCAVIDGTESCGVSDSRVRSR